MRWIIRMDLFIFDQMTLRKPIYIADTIDLEEDIVYPPYCIGESMPVLVNSKRSSGIKLSACKPAVPHISPSIHRSKRTVLTSSDLTPTSWEHIGNAYSSDQIATCAVIEMFCFTARYAPCAPANRSSQGHIAHFNQSLLPDNTDKIRI